MELDFALLALNAEKGAGGKFHIFGGAFDTVEVGELPATIPPFTLVARFTGTADEAGQPHTFAVRIVNPDGEPQDAGNIELKIGEHEGVRSPTRAASALVTINMTFLSEGQYFFQLALDGHTVKSIPIFVILDPAQEQ